MAYSDLERYELFVLITLSLYFVGAATKAESLKNALAEAQKRAAKEQAAREKHEARVRDVQQELQDAVKKCDSLEHNIADQESELAKARQSAQEARVEAHGTLRESRRPSRLRRVRPLLCKENL